MTSAPRTVVELAEYQRRREIAPPPTEADLHLSARLSGDDEARQLEVRWLANGEVDIAASSWVGVVRFTHIDVHVVPKLAGGALQVLRMLEYASGTDILRRLPRTRPLPADGKDLFDLICLLLCQETDALLRDGLVRDYRTEDETLTALRGRLRVRDQFLRRFGQLDRLECHFDEYDADMPDNQFVAAALTVARARATEPGIRVSLGRLATLFAEACQPPTASAEYYTAAIRYGRNNRRYKPAHELSKLILCGMAFGDLFDTTGHDVAAFLIDMNNVFERFATRLVREALAVTHLGVTEQEPLRAVIRNEETGRTYSTIRPDLIIEDTRTRQVVPIDIKYKPYDIKKISTSDIYQAFLYAYALGAHNDERRAGILYPATSPASGPRLSIRPISGALGARIAGASINLPAALGALKTPAHVELLEEVRAIINRTTGLDSRVTR